MSLTLKISFFILLFIALPPKLQCETLTSAPLQSKQICLARTMMQSTNQPVKLKQMRTGWFKRKPSNWVDGSKVKPDHFGFWSLLFGAISIVFVAIISYTFVVAFVIPALLFAGVAIYLGIKGLKKGRKNKWAAILGLISTIPVIAYLGLLIALLFLFAWS